MAGWILGCALASMAAMADEVPIASPLAGSPSKRRVAPLRDPPSEADTPFEGHPPPDDALTRTMPEDGVTPFAEPRPDDGAPPSSVPTAGVRPLEVAPFLASGDAHLGWVARPLGNGPRDPPPVRLDPRKTTMVRLDLGFAPLWRIRRLDTMISTSVEVGRKTGFSGAFSTAIIVDTQREVVRAIDVPIGVGGIARGFLRNKPLAASVGLFVGMLVHRAKSDQGVSHRVDPDFRLPIRFSWTIATMGVSLSLEQGYSVRSRSYERRGAEVWSRHAYRVGFVIALHSDIGVGRATGRRSGDRRGRRR